MLPPVKQVILHHQEIRFHLRAVHLKRTLPVYYRLLSVSILCVIISHCQGQILVSGTVYDSSKLYVIPGVIVSSSSGLSTTTDSLGAYHIRVSARDSLSFFYEGKSTFKFPVKNIDDYNQFDLSLKIRVREKYKLLQGVTVFSNNYEKDSSENRIEYQKYFDYGKPGIHSSYEPGGTAGLDLDAMIEMFNYRKKREDLAFQKRLIEEEHDNYVNYRFNAKLIHRITGLSGDTLERYRKLYTPSYYFIAGSTLTEFYQYILNTSYAFKKEEGMAP